MFHADVGEKNSQRRLLRRTVRIRVRLQEKKKQSKTATRAYQDSESQARDGGVAGNIGKFYLIFDGKPDENLKNKKGGVFELSSGNLNGGAIKQVKTKCSTKWLKYGGCIPGMLETLESVETVGGCIPAPINSTKEYFPWCSIFFPS